MLPQKMKMSQMERAKEKAKKVEEEGVANPSGEHSARDVNHLNELPDNPADENDDTSKLSDDDDVSDEDDDEDYKED